MKARRLYKTNKSGTPGVSWCSKRQAWIAYVCFGGKMKWLGTFPTIQEAVAARKTGEARFWADRMPGVSWDEETNKWVVTVSVDGLDRFLGFFATREEAVEARRLANSTTLEGSLHPCHADGGA
jgi:hypothetical protein